MQGDLLKPKRDSNKKRKGKEIAMTKRKEGRRQVNKEIFDSEKGGVFIPAEVEKEFRARKQTRSFFFLTLRTLFF